ncbi:flagellin [Duganella sp. HH101]|uniref:flagellin N-terminal helical domain-containing protein n=1 Tax=Duganella sp. HH101 TaxID=1781066 RepID=UPI00087483D3|nr:flagellin [Duganella sp. HH101]OFA02302.1 B-type flagellin [Duganella sp. HH101]
MQINTNLSSLNAQRSYALSGEEMAARLQKLSSGLRINSARDDAAGLAISDRMSSDINGLRRARQNINDGISLLQVADGATGQLLGNFQRMRELAVQAANDTNSKVDRAAIQVEVNALVASNVDIVAGARYNNLALLDGSFSQQLQVGSQAGQTLALAIPAALAPASYNKTLVNVAPQQATLVGTAVLGAIAYGDVIINNTAVGASSAGAQPGQGAASAYAVAAAINAANVRDVTASAATTLSGDVGASGVLAAGSFSINGVNIGAIAGNTAAIRAANAAGAISAASATSGVTASASGGTLTLSAADGRDIIIIESNPGSTASLGLALGTHKGNVTVSNVPRPGSHPISISGGNPAAAGLLAGRQASVVVGPPDLQLQDVYSGGEPVQDLSNFSGATAALDYYDGKIDQVSEIRAALGAASNRLSAAAGNDESGANNLEAARSRIRDTDYASETAQLTRASILRQAGASMLAQANAQPRYALLLLR